MNTPMRLLVRLLMLAALGGCSGLGSFGGAAKAPDGGPRKTTLAKLDDSGAIRAPAQSPERLVVNPKKPVADLGLNDDERKQLDALSIVCVSHVGVDGKKFRKCMNGMLSGNQCHVLTAAHGFQDNAYTQFLFSVFEFARARDLDLEDVDTFTAILGTIDFTMGRPSTNNPKTALRNNQKLISKLLGVNNNNRVVIDFPAINFSTEATLVRNEFEGREIESAAKHITDNRLFWLNEKSFREDIENGQRVAAGDVAILKLKKPVDAASALALDLLTSLDQINPENKITKDMMLAMYAEGEKNEFGTVSDGDLIGLEGNPDWPIFKIITASYENAGDKNVRLMGQKTIGGVDSDEIFTNQLAEGGNSGSGIFGRTRSGLKVIGITVMGSDSAVARGEGLFPIGLNLMGRTDLLRNLKQCP